MSTVTLHLEHCFTLFLCYLGDETMITEIQISITKIIWWATNYFAPTSDARNAALLSPVYGYKNLDIPDATLMAAKH